MKKFIHIRGSMGSGKTTAVRQYLQRTGGFTLHHISVQGKSYPYHFNKTKSIIITGIYGRRICDGCDGLITNRDIMMEYLLKLVDAVSPDVVIFEAVMYGVTSTFAINLSENLSKRGYHYKGVALIPPVEFCLSNVMTRNGGKSINLKAFYDKWQQSKRSAENLKEKGLDIDIVDTSRIRMDQMNTLIERELAE